MFFPEIFLGIKLWNEKKPILEPTLNLTQWPCLHKAMHFTPIGHFLIEFSIGRQSSRVLQANSACKEKIIWKVILLKTFKLCHLVGIFYSLGNNVIDLLFQTFANLGKFFGEANIFALNIFYHSDNVNYKIVTKYDDNKPNLRTLRINARGQKNLSS